MQDFGIRDAEFWGMSLKQFDVLSRRYERKKKDSDYQFAILLAMIHNRTIQTKKERAKKPEDFMDTSEELSQEDFDKKVLASFHIIKAYANAN